MEFATEQRDCDALADLFQHTVNNMKGSYPVWEDFMNKASKLHAAFRTVTVATSAFLDAFQKVADLANGSLGATRELGAALTRLCIRQRSVEGKLKTFAGLLVESLVEPLAVKMEDWKKSANQLDKDHGREFKKTQQDIKKTSTDSIRLSKRMSKGLTEVQLKYEQSLQEVRDKYRLFEVTETLAVRSALTEEHSRFCYFIHCLKPVMDAEVEILAEMTNIQDIVNVLSSHTSNDERLSQSVEQILTDIKQNENNSNFKRQSSTGSPVLSRKSSMCSVNSSSSGSTCEPLVQSPCTRGSNGKVNQCSSAKDGEFKISGLRQPSSVSSQDSGFVTSQELVFNESCCCKDVVVDDVRQHPTADTVGCEHASVSCRSTLSRPSLTSQTFIDPKAATTTATSAVIYATPNVPVPLLQRTADIQSRLSVIYARRVSQNGLQPISAPVVPPPSEYATCGFMSKKLSAGKSSTPQFHRSCSLPPPLSLITGEGNGSASLRSKYVTDENYLASTPQEFTRQKSQDLESLNNDCPHNSSLFDDSKKFMTLPRNCLPFKIPEVPVQRMNSATGKAKPPPPTRRHSTNISVSAAAAVSRNSRVTECFNIAIDDSSETAVAAAGEIPKQQDPPTDDISDTLCLPAAPVAKFQLGADLSSQMRIRSSADGADGSKEPVVFTTDPCSSSSSQPIASAVAASDCSSSSFVHTANQFSMITPSSLNGVNSVNCYNSPPEMETAAAAATDGSTDVVCMLELIRRGVKLRKAESFDRSAPRLRSS